MDRVSDDEIREFLLLGIENANPRYTIPIRILSSHLNQAYQEVDRLRIRLEAKAGGYEYDDSLRPLEIGDVLHGYCGGNFGRDSYNCKIVEQIGPGYVLARQEFGEWPEMATGSGIADRLREYRTDFSACEHGRNQHTADS